MSYHLSMRNLQMSCLTPGVGSFVDCIEHSLAGEHPAWKLQRQMQTSDSLRLTLGSATERTRELLAVDLNPVGQAMRLATNDNAWQRMWSFYNERGNVVSKVDYKDQLGSEILIEGEQMTRAEKRIIANCHEKLRISLRDVLSAQPRQNESSLVRVRKLEDARVSSVARIFGVGQLVAELSEFFEQFPAAKVSDACKILSVHPRLIERRMHELGITAVKLKRACMLSRATHQILWSNRSFGEIALNSGYTHGAHLSRVIFFATGGMTPSFLRSLV